MSADFLCSALCIKFSANNRLKYFSYFSPKTEENNKNINLSSAELAQRMLLLIWVIDTLQGKQLCQKFCFAFPVLRGLLAAAANSFFLNGSLFRRGLVCRKAIGSHGHCLYYKTGRKNLKSVSHLLNPF